MDDGHIGTQFHYVLDDVGGEDHDYVFADFREQVVKAIALARIEAGGGLVDDQELAGCPSAPGRSESLAHAARKTGSAFLRTA